MLYSTTNPKTEPGKAGNDRRELVAEGYKTAFQAAVAKVGDFLPYSTTNQKQKNNGFESASLFKIRKRDTKENVGRKVATKRNSGLSLNPIFQNGTGVLMSFAETGPLTVFHHEAMAADFEISLNEKGSDAWAGAALDAFDEVDRLEELLSVFRATSPVSRLNLLAAEMNVKTDRELIDYIKLSRQISADTEGAFDITTMPLWEIWGFSRRQGEVPTEQEIQKALSCVGMNLIRIREEESTVAFDRPGVSINFGGIGKGIAMDRAAALLMDRGVPNFLIHGGKSSIVAHGGRSGDSFWKKENDSVSSHEFPCWTIGLGHPLQPNQRLAKIHLSNIALATSGSQYQFFRYKGERLAHILNPKTGQPVRGTLAVTVLAPDATTADALSTAFFVMGPEKTEAFCSTHPEIAVIYCLETRKSPGYSLLYFNISKEILSFY